MERVVAALGEEKAKELLWTEENFNLFFQIKFNAAMSGPLYTMTKKQWSERKVEVPEEVKKIISDKIVATNKEEIDKVMKEKSSQGGAINKIEVGVWYEL